MRRLLRPAAAAAAAGLLLLPACSGGDGAAAPPDPHAGAVTADEAVYHLHRADEEGAPWTLVRALPDGGSQRVATPEGAGLTVPDVSPDGSAIAYVAFGTVEGIWVSDLLGEVVPVQVWTGPDAFCPRWFPDGKRLAVVVGDQVVVIDLATGEGAPVGPSTFGLSLSCADPLDDDTVVVAATPNTQVPRPTLSTLELADGSLTPVGALANDCVINLPAVAPDGTQVAVDAICDDPAGNGLWTLPLAGGPPDRVLAAPAGAELWGPAWAPDGQSLLYHRLVGGAATVRRVGLDGTGDREVAGRRSELPTAGPPPPER